MRSPDPSFAIRVDATSQIGAGHFMRCLALADALRERGGRVQFVGRRIAGHMRELAIGNGHLVATLSPAPESGPVDDLTHARWLGTSQRADAELTVEALAHKRVDWLIVDHYALDARWESSLRQYTKSILVIDDLADRAHDCDMLLDQNLHGDMQKRYCSKVPARCKLLLGPQHALLRQEFREVRASARARDGSVRRILILMGGVDPDNFTSKAIDAVSRIQRPVEVDVVVGAEHPARDAIAKTCEDHGYALHVQPSNIAKLMGTADMAVGAGGSTNWERCCVGVPGVVISVADNQDHIAKSLHKAGAIFYVGRSDSVGVETIVRQLRELLADPAKVAEAARKGMALVDGNGTARVANAMWRRQ